ncbi:MAG: AAA family ATPase [Bacteroidota bacterium]
MYIDYIKIENIRSIEKIEVRLHLMGEENLPGWHVFIGDNGSGKTSFIRSVSIGLIGPTEAVALRENWGDWIRKGSVYGNISLNVRRDPNFDSYKSRGKGIKNVPIKCQLQIGADEEAEKENSVIRLIAIKDRTTLNYIWSGRKAWFSAAYGPFRRFRGGDKDLEKIFYSNPRAAAHISAFGEDAALAEVEDWLRNLHFQRLEQKPVATKMLEGIHTFINQGSLLPHDARLHRIDSEVISFIDGNQNEITLNELSDGYRSVLSLTFELLRQLIATYGHRLVFPDGFASNPIINLPGVVLIDEIDAHLHPTWQVRIGQWFTQYFPKLQFIVTTHSPLICRAAEKGSVWRLAAPGTNEQARQITGTELQRLIYGNVLDAYGTEVFGEGVTSSEQAIGKRERLAELSKKSIKGTISESESQELQAIKAVLPTGG